MKNIITSVGILSLCLFMFSFSINKNNKINYIELKNNSISPSIVGKFTRVTYMEYTPDKGTWERQRESWKLANPKKNKLSKLNNILNNY